MAHTRKVSLLVLMIVAVPTARAEDRPVHFALSGGVGRGIGGPFTRPASAGAALSGGAYVALSQMISLGLEAGWASRLSDEKRSDETVTVQGPTAYDTHTSLAAWRLTPALEWRGGSGLLRPRAAVALGYYRLDRREQSRSTFANLNYDVTNQKGTGGLGLAAGLDALFLPHSLGVGVELRFDSAFNDVDGNPDFESWWTLSAGIRF